MVFLSSQAKDKIEYIVAEAVKSERTPSLVFGAGNVLGETLFVQASSEICEVPANQCVDKDSVFWICSFTKLVTAVAVLQLIEQGKLALDTVVSSILPEVADPIIVDYPQPDMPPVGRAKTPITIKHLLTHTSGFFYNARNKNPPFGLVYSYTADHKKDNPVHHFINTVKGNYSNVPLKFEPGTQFAYGFSMDFLGFIVERISGQTLEGYFKEHIFSPLGITSASFYRTPDLKERAIPLVFRNEDGNLTTWANQCPITEQDPEKVYVHLGGIGLHSSLKDYLTFLQHLLKINAGFATNAILKFESVRCLFEPALTEAAAKTLNAQLIGTDYQWSYGLCLNTTDWPGKRRKGSGTWYGWAGTYYFMDPTSGVALVLGSQIVPARDPQVLKVWEDIEEAFYEGLVN